MKMAISFFCSCHHNYSIIFLSWSSWLGWHVSRWGRYFTCSWEPCEYIFERVHLELFNSVYFGTISVFILYFLAISTTHFDWFQSWWRATEQHINYWERERWRWWFRLCWSYWWCSVETWWELVCYYCCQSRKSPWTWTKKRMQRAWAWMQRAWTCSQRVVDVDVDVEVVDKGEEMTML